MAETKRIGAVGLVPRGNWSATEQYTKLSVVRHGTGKYVAKQANLNIEPGANENWESYWMLAVSDGGDIDEIVTGESYTNDQNFTVTPVEIKNASGASSFVNFFAKNGNAGVQVITRTITLAANAWTGSATPYTQTVTVTGVTTTSLNFITPVTTATASELETLYDANLQDGGQAANSITFKCYGKLPLQDVTLRVVIVLPASGAQAVYQTINTTQYGGA